MKIVTPSQMKSIENYSEKLGVSRRQLMQNAGTALADIINEYCVTENLDKSDKTSIVFLAGSGNNGGDCFVAARILAEQEYKVTVINLCGRPHTPLSQDAFRLLAGTKVHILKAYRGQNIKSVMEAAEIDFMTVSQDDVISESNEKPEPSALVKLQLEEKERIESAMKVLENADIIVDGIFGTGFHGKLDKEISEFLASGKNAYRFAVDVPSGGNCLDGSSAEGTAYANETIVFGALKTGLTQYPLKGFCGEIRLVDIGIPAEAFEASDSSRKYTLTDEEELEDFPKKRPENSHKGNFGRVLCITGSSGMRGASVLSAMGALRSGAGLVTIASVEKVIDSAVILAPEATFCELECDNNGYMLFENNCNLLIKEMNRADAILIGCGMGVTDDTVKLTKFVIENANCPITIDADGINCIASDIDILLKKKTDIILTPHPGEMARLMENYADLGRFAAAEQFAEKYNVTVVLKGSGTIIADAHKTAVNPNGNPGMSCGGSGDVLAGITASLTAQGYPSYNASRISAYLHGLAGDTAAQKLGQEAMLPRDIIDALSDSFGIIKKRTSARRRCNL